MRFAHWRRACGTPPSLIKTCGASRCKSAKRFSQVFVCIRLLRNYLHPYSDFIKQVNIQIHYITFRNKMIAYFGNCPGFPGKIFANRFSLTPYAAALFSGEKTRPPNGDPAGGGGMFKSLRGHGSVDGGGDILDVVYAAAVCEDHHHIGARGGVDDGRVV